MRVSRTMKLGVVDHREYTRVYSDGMPDVSRCDDGTVLLITERDSGTGAWCAVELLPSDLRRIAQLFNAQEWAAFGDDW